MVLLHGINAVSTRRKLLLWGRLTLLNENICWPVEYQVTYSSGKVLLWLCCLYSYRRLFVSRYTVAVSSKYPHSARFSCYTASFIDRYAGSYPFMWTASQTFLSCYRASCSFPTRRSRTILPSILTIHLPQHHIVRGGSTPLILRQAIRHGPEKIVLIFLPHSLKVRGEVLPELN